MIMRYVIVPIEDVRDLFTSDELEHARKNVDGTRMIVHEETLLRKREKLGVETLPMHGDTGMPEWTYPVYEYNSDDLYDLLHSYEWDVGKEYDYTDDFSL